MTAADTHRAIEAVWRIEAARLIAGLAGLVRDIGLAEELAQDALVAALEQWPESGVPRNPGAWLMTVSKRRAIDLIRRNERLQRNLVELGHRLDLEEEPPEVDEIEDDLLRLVFTACHPALSMEARVALTLRVLGGLTTDEIARAFLVPEPTVAQRIVRAKRTLADKRVPFEVPQGAELAGRLSSVLEVIYLIFNEGYSATAGDDWMRPGLCEDALRLGRVLAGLMPREPEVHGLVALMEIQASRSAARVGPSGEPILLLEQNRARWDRLLIGRGLAALDRAEELSDAPGPYTLQAAIAACHARALAAEDTDWARIAALYEALARMSRSPVVELNRAVALSMAYGPVAGLELLDQIVDEPSLKDYHLLPSVRGDLLVKLGRAEEARGEFERAAGMTRNTRERALLQERAAACRGDGG
ncbi:RNA polymerase sigma factor [Nonomuraea gerenzanensis]|uniref:RNA polymerase sigma factor n=1 Tax=Nonomuraea gerenzanensis TaxID=93944 RepID=A0A1M4E878_9ACTN|nr:RNA polymerase sigma factor [Nonomuraea gerenzanensis]UBU17271.1 RNA polymerase sigma factor [Nonomuraea gerenzanensis]SBO95015.1 RNA polymerase sigma-70 factor, ECF subfamily [Nonomuraea gerenzanensis]